MTFAAHQPHYLPSLAWWHKMVRAETFVVADEVQYVTGNSMNRCRIKTPEGVQWLTVPVVTKGKGRQSIRDVRISNQSDWRKRHLHTLRLNYAKAAFFDLYFPSFEQLYERKWRFLIDLNLAALDLLRESLHLRTPVILSSSLNISTRGTNKIVAIAQQVGGEIYLTEPEAKNHLDESKFTEFGIAVQFESFPPPSYHQLFGNFAPNLSIIDLLFNEGEESKSILLG